MFFKLDIPAEVKMVHRIAQSGVLSRPAEPIKPRKPTKAEQVARLVESRDELHEEMTRNFSRMAGTEWMADRIAEMERYNRQLERLGYKG
jgi:hypothetical protein